VCFAPLSLGPPHPPFCFSPFSGFLFCVAWEEGLLLEGNLEGLVDSSLVLLFGAAWRMDVVVAFFLLFSFYC
jgi:hypothetical protein